MSTSQSIRIRLVARDKSHFINKRIKFVHTNRMWGEIPINYALNIDFVTIQTDVHKKIDLFLGKIDSENHEPDTPEKVTISHHIKHSATPTEDESDTLFTAYLKVDEYFISKKPIIHSNLIGALAFLGGLYRSLHFMINLPVFMLA